MSVEVFIANDRERQLIQETVRRVLGSSYRTRNVSQEDPLSYAPDVYVASCIGSAGLPAREDEVPGVADCYVYRISPNNGSGSGTDGEFILEQLQGTYEVFNISTSIVSDEYFQIHRSKHGKWLAVTGGSGSTLKKAMLLADAIAGGPPVSALVLDEKTGQLPDTDEIVSLYNSADSGNYAAASRVRYQPDVDVIVALDCTVEQED